LVLGCTHFPFLRALIEQAAGPDVRVIDTGEAVARRVAKVAETLGSKFSKASGVAFWTSGDARALAGPLGKLWGHRVALADLPGEYAGRGD
jgi:glutamate racemase